MEGAKEYPIDLGSEELNKKVVYSPHVYGPDAFVQPYFSKKAGFPKNLAPIWKDQWAFIEEATGRAAVVGEWGGHYKKGSDDKVWQDAFAEFLVEECLEDTFYWCLNPNRYVVLSPPTQLHPFLYPLLPMNALVHQHCIIIPKQPKAFSGLFSPIHPPTYLSYSGDTGGLLDYDFVTPIPEKLALLAKVQPNPTFVSAKAPGQYCITPGAYANPAKCDKGRRLTVVAQA